MKYNQKHLTLCERIIIEQGLNEGKSFTAIASILEKDPTTVSKEIKKHLTIKHHNDKTRKPRYAKEKLCMIHGYQMRNNLFVPFLILAGHNKASTSKFLFTNPPSSK